MRWVRGRGRRWGALVALGGALAAAGAELPYVNWRPAVPPVETERLLIRQDAKGDGRFLAPRSGNRRHRGVDFAAPLNSPVRAIRSGRVVEVGEHPGLGRYVEVAHRGRLRSLYAHLHEARVAPGRRVRQGAVIGAVGKTGNARHRWIVPHLHVEVRRDGEPIDLQTLGLQAQDPGEPAHADGSGPSFAADQPASHDAAR